MADLPAKTVETIKKLLDVMVEEHGKTGELIEEIQRLLSGQPGIGATLKRLETAFDLAWGARYAKGVAGKYVWRYVQDRPHLKRLIKSVGVEELEARFLRYLQSDEDFFTRSRHPFSLFVSSVNQWASAASAAPGFDLEPVPDCRHTPRCTSDAQHTKRKNAEMRS